MKQSQLITELQRAAMDEWRRMFPDVELHPVPLVIGLPAGIHPYSRACAYYDPEGNAIVLYQHLGREAIQDGATDQVISTIRHELIHVHQYHVQGYRKTSTVNVHRHATWQTGCYLASRQLWRDFPWQKEMFTPLLSKRIDGKPVKVQRMGALTDVELHHWPRSIPEFMTRHGVYHEHMNYTSEANS